LDFINFLTRAQSNLSTNVSVGATSITVANGSTFTHFPTVLLIDNELFLATSKAATTPAPAAIIQVTRAYEATIEAPHIVGTLVTAVITAGGLENRLSNIIQYGSISDTFEVTPKGAGRIFLANDAPVLFMDQGGSDLLQFERWHNLYLYYTLIDWVNQGTSSKITPSYPNSLQINSGSTLHDHLTGLRYQLSVQGYLTSRLLCIPKQIVTDYYEYGLFFSDASSTKFVTLSIRIGDTVSPQLRCDKWSNPTTVAGNYFNMAVFLEQVKYLRIKFKPSPADTNMLFFIGPDPTHMTQIFSMDKSDFILAPEYCGYFVNARQANSSYLLYDYYTVQDILT